MTSENTEPKQEQPASEQPAEKPAPPTLEQTLAYTVQKADSYLESWKRAQADFANLKKRTDQEKAEMAKYANMQLVINLLPVLDDFDRAFEHMPHKVAKSEWAEGFKLIANKLLSVLEAQGLTVIKATGTSFDPNLHEACLHDKGAEGVVVKELRKGYMLFDKVIRPTQAVVGNGEKVESEPEPKQDNNHIKKNEQESQ